MSSLATPDTLFLRLIRGTLIASVLAVPFCIAATILLSRAGIWWIARWMNSALYLAMVVSVVAGVFRLAHSIWATARFDMLELLFTFFAAGFASIFAADWIKPVLQAGRADRDVSMGVAATVLLVFLLFVSGSAWAWGIFSRVRELSLNRKAVLICGWVSSVGVLCLTSFLFLSVFLVLTGRIPTERARNIYKFAMMGMVLTAPGILIEWEARRHTKRALAATNER